jgi:hypothetical protein
VEVLVIGFEICTTTAATKRHLARSLGPDRHAPRQPGRHGRTLCGHTGVDQERVSYLVGKGLSRCRKPIADLPPCLSCAHAAGEAAGQAFRLSGDQLDAIRALLGLVHYDDLAKSWLDLLPQAFRPEVPTDEQR